MNPSDILLKAKELIDTPDKWWKHDGSKSRGKLLCLGQAIALATPNSEIVGTYCMAIDYARNAAKQLYMQDVKKLTIAGFNDHPDTTHEHILNVLDRAHEIARDAEKPPKEPGNLL